MKTNSPITPRVGPPFIVRIACNAGCKCTVGQCDPACTCTVTPGAADGCACCARNAAERAAALAAALSAEEAGATSGGEQPAGSSHSGNTVAEK